MRGEGIGVRGRTRELRVIVHEDDPTDEFARAIIEGSVSAPAECLCPCHVNPVLLYCDVCKSIHVAPPPASDRYRPLRKILDSVFQRVAEGKGEERHGKGLMWDEQPWLDVRRHRPGFCLGQAEKKLREAGGLPLEEAAKELRDAIGYIASEIRALELGCDR